MLTQHLKKKNFFAGWKPNCNILYQPKFCNDALYCFFFTITKATQKDFNCNLEKHNSI